MITCPICDYHYSEKRNHCPICATSHNDFGTYHRIITVVRNGIKCHTVDVVRATGAELQRTSGKSDANCSNRHERLQVSDWFALGA